MRIYIVRHGNTFEKNEAPRRVGSETDVPLVESGFIQAESLGKDLLGKKIIFSNVYSSPLLRAKQTTQKILEQLNSNLVIEHLDFLNEINHGVDENKVESEVVERIGNAAIRDWDEKAIEPNGWIVNAEKRMNGFRDFVENHRRFVDTNILMVTSNGAARFLLQAYQIKHSHKNLKLRTGSYGCVEFLKESISLKCWDIRPDISVNSKS